MGSRRVVSPLMLMLAVFIVVPASVLSSIRQLIEKISRKDVEVQRLAALNR